VREACPGCGEALHHHRADDAPAYFTILIVGHVIVGAVLPVERAFAPPLWLHALLWGPLTLALTLVLLPRIKGAVVALQWALCMHGFGAQKPEQPAFRLGCNKAKPHCTADRSFRPRSDRRNTG
jgi:uncharacterized protein (DUF983 family)